MGRIWVREFTGGLDTRRLPETTPGGVLIKGQDGHINSGGEFEKRAAFVATYSLPAGTVGLAYDRASIIVFGSAVSPSMPSGVTYQRLQHSSDVLVDVPSWDLYGGDVYAVGEFDDGTIAHFFDTAAVTDWFDGRARASFRVTAGTSGGLGQLDSLTVGGVEILSAAVPWDTSHPQTAEDIADNINAHTSTPDYEATAVDDRVNIIAADAGTDANNRSVTFTLSGDMAVDPQVGLVLEGGVDSTAFVPGQFVKTIGSKEYAVSGGTVHFSGIQLPTKWTTDNVGAGFFDLSKVASGAEELLALANYQGFVAAFAETVIVILFVDPDPDLVRETQILANTGTVAPQSVTQFGDADVFYLALSGLRSLKARETTSSATTTDLGVPVDSLITAKLATMTADQRKGVIGLINPVDGRFWLCFPDGQIFVFSFYPNAKVSAWTTYETGFAVDAAVVFNRRVHLRSGNTIYVYGGLDSGSGLQYDSTVAKAWLPFLDADKPTELKEWQGLDAAVEGTWNVYMAQQPTDVTVRELVATLTETTFNAPRIPWQASSTHAGPHLESSGAGPAKLSSLILHYDDGEDG